MINVLEEKYMVNQINEATSLKPIETDNRIKAKLQDNSKKMDSENNLSLDSVCLSHTSKQLEALKASLRDTPEINAARVLYFKNEIETGNYQINSDSIADKILNELETA
jgi:negative regulator of flagellin synthesis FlgM